MLETDSQVKLLNKQASKVKLLNKQAASLYNNLTNEDQGDVAQIETGSEREIAYTYHGENRGKAGILATAETSFHGVTERGSLL